MSTYVIGDVQGCFRTLEALLKTLDVNLGTDSIWLLGDLVGRGPDALSVLRFVDAHPGSVRAILGNHDLALLAASHGLLTPHPSDKLDDVLRAPDCASLLSSLRAHPFVHLHEHRLLVHAGVLPTWSPSNIEQRGRAASAAIASPHRAPAFLARLFRLPGAPIPSPSEQEIDESIEVLTCVRTLDQDGLPYAAYKGELSTMPASVMPWFRWPEPAWKELSVCCGHWSALGLYREGRITALDGGCVWGRSLCAMRLEDGALFEVSNAETNG